MRFKILKLLNLRIKEIIKYINNLLGTKLKNSISLIII